MRPRIKIRQEGPLHTRARFGIRMWELFVYEPGTDRYEYYGFTMTLPEAIRIAEIIYRRPMPAHMAFAQEVTA